MDHLASSPSPPPFLESAAGAKTNLSYKLLPACIWHREQLRYSQHFQSFFFYFPGPVFRPEPLKLRPTSEPKLTKCSLSMGLMLCNAPWCCFHTPEPCYQYRSRKRKNVTWSIVFLYTYTFPFRTTEHKHMYYFAYFVTCNLTFIVNDHIRTFL